MDTLEITFLQTFKTTENKNGMLCHIHRHKRKVCNSVNRPYSYPKSWLCRIQRTHIFLEPVQIFSSRFHVDTIFKDLAMPLGLKNAPRIKRTIKKYSELTCTFEIQLADFVNYRLGIVWLFGTYIKNSWL